MILSIEDISVLAGLGIAFSSPAYYLLYANLKSIEKLRTRMTKIETEHDMYHDGHVSLSLR